MNALMSWTSSFLEWLGRYVGLVLFGGVICDSLGYSDHYDNRLL